MRPALSLICLACALTGCTSDGRQTPADPIPTVAAVRATEPTFRAWAADAAVWRDSANPDRSVLVISAGEAGLELHDLQGARLARYEDIEAGLVEIASEAPDGLRGIVIASDQRLGALRIFRLDAAARALTEIGAAPIELHDEITGLCTYVSPLTNKLYVYAATNQGQLEQWELAERDGRVAGRFVRRIAAGKGVAHCDADDAAQRIYFSEESVGIWSIEAEPESDATRVPIDLIAPRGGLHEEVKGLALFRSGPDTAHLIARDAGAGEFVVYSLASEATKRFRIGGSIEVGDAEGLTVLAEPLGAELPSGALVIADEDAGDYKLVSLATLASTLALPTSSAAATASRPKFTTVQPVLETEPAASYGDAADDPAIWVDTKNPARSVVIATDKKLGLNLYDLSGKLLQTVPDGRMNNVDLRDGFKLGDASITLVAATNRTTKSIGLYRYDPTSQRLSPIADGVLATDFEDPYGLCMYRSAKTGAYYVLANDSVDGKLRQWRLVESNGKVGMKLVREIAVGSQAEGCAADDELGALYVAEEDVGLWRYGAEPDSGTARTAIDSVKSGKLTDDVEGVSIWSGPNGTGYLVVSNQGENNYAVYRREGANDYVGKFHVVASSERGVDGASETDGLDVVSAPLGSQFPEGLLVVQDGRNLMPVERQNFKYVSWKDVMQALQK